MNNVFKEIETELQRSNFYKFNNIMFESRGVYDKTIPLIDELYNYLKNNMNFLQLNGERVENDNRLKFTEYQYIFNNIELNIDSFLKTFSVNLIIHVYADKKVYERENYGFFENKGCSIIVDNGNKKLNGGLFKLIIPCKNRFTLNFDDFSKLMIHELHHAYRLFNVLSSNNPTSIEKYNKSAKEYKSFQNINNVNEITTEFLNAIKNICYSTDDDEINAVVTEIYSIIRNNTKINSENYVNYLPSFDAYKRLKNLESCYMTLIDGKKYLSKSISTIINHALNQNKNENENMSFILKRIANRIVTLKEKIYHVIGKALTDFNRIVKNEEKNYIATRYNLYSDEAWQYSHLIIKYAHTYL